MAIFTIFIILLLLGRLEGTFIYLDFEDTTGLNFVDSAGTTNCYDNPQTRYGDVEQKADILFQPKTSDRKETTSLIFETHLELNSKEKDSKIIDQSQAGFRHRSDTKISPKNCRHRARLTPSYPSSRGAMWYRDTVPVTNGFDTLFSFQISDHSKECVLVKDQYLSQKSYETCNIHGGDGFAFVIQNAPQGMESVGETGGQTGYGGIPNSLAISFDTWQNPNLNQDLIGVDNISVHSKGVNANDAFQSGLLGTPKVYPLADGITHLVRIVYFNSLKPQYFQKLVASSSLLPYLKDNGEQKRLGTLAIFIDDGIEKDDPLLVMPINLSVLLHLPVDEAYVGFVAATGKYFEKHDILNWIFCESVPCEHPDITQFDYHQTSKFSSTSTVRSNTPGSGYGGESDVEKSFPIQNSNPDTTAVAEKKEYFASVIETQLDGLSKDPYSSFQVLPDTLY